MERRRLLATIIVNTTADDTLPDATLSIREAIEIANGTLPLSALSPQERSQVIGVPTSPAPDTIDFDIPGGGVQTIKLLSPLPAITDPVIIDGYTQPGSSPNTLANGDNAVLDIVLNGASAGTGVAGLEISAGGSTIQGLVIDGFLSSGVRVEGAGATGNLIEGNFIGTDATGTAALGNASDGVFLLAPGNTVGGATVGARNLISGNVAAGIELHDSGDVIEGNYIGTNVTGASKLGNVGDGVLLNGPTAAGNTILGNVISGNTQYGVQILSGSHGNTIAGNLIGTDATGALPLGNAMIGVRIANGSNGNTVGGTAATSRNVISDNVLGGVNEFGPATGNVVEGNYVGTDVTGTHALGKQGYGVAVSGTGTQVVGNVVSANSLYGIWVVSGGNGVMIQGNKVGTDAQDQNGLGNGVYGVYIQGAHTLVGGAAPGAGLANTIAFNTGPGVEVTGATSLQNAILSNAIFSNTAAGIVLANGANNNQAAPVLNSVAGGATAVVSGVISGTVPGQYVVQVFGNDQASPLSGKTLLATTSVTHSAAGSTAFQANLSLGGTNPPFLTATVTDPSGNTSQFSNALATAGQFDFSAPSYTVVANGTVTVTVNRNIGSLGTVTVNYATAGGTAVPGVDYIPASGTLTFAPGQTTQTFKITTLPTFKLGPTLTIGLGLSKPGGGAVLGPQSTAVVNVPNLNSLVVTNTNDSGRGSLRQAILTANATPGLNTITFNIPGTGVHTISPMSPLPLITDPVVIDGYTQPGSSPNTLANGDNAVLNVVLNGANAGTGVNGLVIDTGGSRVRGLVIQGFVASPVIGDPAHSGGNGIFLAAGGNTVTGNFIGTNAGGTTAVANGQTGVISFDAAGNTIGGTTPDTRNVISGNRSGVQIEGSGARGNLIEGNFIGTNAAGATGLGNTFDGVDVGGGASNNKIGGTAAGAGNTIAGNGGEGIDLEDAGTAGNLVQGNFVGTNAAGATGLGNHLDGVMLLNASNTLIGPSNILSGNGVNEEGAGINIQGTGAQGNMVIGNLIGTNPTGTAGLGNSLIGVFVGDGASNNVIGVIGQRNVISGNGTPNNLGVGVYLFGSGTRGNAVVGNLIGTNAAGNGGITGSVIGVLVNGAPGNTVGGASPAARNIVSGHRYVGIEIAGATATGNTVQGNRVGTNINGTAAIPNGYDGIFLNDTPGNLIGGIQAGQGNQISGNGSVGIQLFGPNTTGNVVEGNALGLDAAGRLTLPNGVGMANGIFINTTPGVNTISRNTGQKFQTSLAPSVSQQSATARSAISVRQVKPAATAGQGPFVNRPWARSGAPRSV
jgi:parallel beta-helix repeat protein